MNNIIYKITIIIISIIAIYGCKSKIDFLDTKKHIAIPLIKSNISVLQLFSDTLLKSKNSGLNLVLEQSFSPLKLDTLVNSLLDTSFKTVIKSLFSFNFPAGTQILNLQQKTKLNLKDIKLTLIKVKTGKIEITYKNSVKGTLKCEYKLSSATKNNLPIIINETLPAATNTSKGILVKQYDLDNTSINLTGLLGNTTNELNYEIACTIPNTSTTTFVSINDSIEVTIKFLNIKPSYARGFFGKYKTKITEEINLDFIGKLPIETIDINKIKVGVYYKNYSGVDISFVLKSIIPNNSSFTGNIINKINYLYRALEQGIGLNNVKYAESAIEIDELNSNITSVINNKPTKVIVNAELNISPNGNLNLNNDFLYTDNAVEGKFKLELPLNFKFKNLAISDTITYSIDMVANKISAATLHLLIKNTTNLNAIGNLRLQNENKINSSSFKKSIFLNNLTASQRIDINLSNNEIENIIKNKYMLIDFLIDKNNSNNIIANSSIESTITIDFITKGNND